MQTGLDAAATAADRVQTATDRVQTTADRVQTTADRVQTTADRVQTTADAATALAARGRCYTISKHLCNYCIGYCRHNKRTIFFCTNFANPIFSFAIYKNNAGVELYVTSLPNAAITQTCATIIHGTS